MHCPMLRWLIDWVFNSSSPQTFVPREIDVVIYYVKFISIYRVYCWLIGCLMACQHRKFNLCQLGGRKPVRSVKDGQRDTMLIPHVTRKQCNTVCSKTLQLHKRNSRLFSRWLTCVFTNTKPDHTHPIWYLLFHSGRCSLTSCPGYM